MIPDAGVKLLHAALRCLGIYAVLLGGLWWFGEPASARLLPLIDLEVKALLPAFEVESVHLLRQPHELTVQVETVVRGAVFAGTRLTPLRSGASFSAATTTAHLWQPLLLTFAIGFAVPASNCKRLLLRWLVALAVVIAVMLADLPLVLTGAVEDMVYSAFCPEEFSIATRLGAFLDSGGRLALGVCAGLVCAALGVAPGVAAPRRVAGT